MRTRITTLAVAALGVLLVILVPTTAGAASLTNSRPHQAVCRSQGGTFSVAIDFASLWCDKPGGRDGITGTGTFCSTALPVRH
jgi:hypothetical protein